MATLDIFNNNAFKLNSMLEAIRAIDYLPTRLGQMNVFTRKNPRTETVSIEKKDEVLSLIQTSPRGAPLPQKTTKKRNIRNFSGFRIAEGDRITASELANIRAFGTESELMQVQAEVADRIGGPGGLMSKVEMTWENMRLGCIQGKVLDADGTVLNDWYSEWGYTPLPTAEFAFDLANKKDGALLNMCMDVRTAMMVNSKGAWVPGVTQCHAFCGTGFYQKFRANAEYRASFLNQADANLLRNGYGFDMFEFGNITFEHYRGTDDGSTISIATDEVKFFPVNAPGVFLEIFLPGETFSTINRPGEPIYPLIIPDKERDMYADIEVYSYPLYVCTRPAMIQKGRAGA